MSLEEQHGDELSKILMTELIPMTLQSLEKKHEANMYHSGISTGFYDIDKHIGGFHNSDLIIIAGRPAMGKTALALNIATNAAYSNDAKSVAFFTLETSAQNLTQRLISSIAHVESNKFRSGHFSQEEWMKVSAAGGELTETKLVIDDKSAININKLKERCYEIKDEQGLDMIFVDYLQLMFANKGDTREQQISYISRSLKALAKELDIPVIAISQLNRGAEQRMDKRPILFDLRDSGALEDDADLIFFLYRDELYTKDMCIKPGVAEIMLAKNRFGAREDFELAFIKEYMQFRDIAKSE